MDDELLRILKYFPERVSKAATSFFRLLKGKTEYVSELRIRADAPMSITFCGKNVSVFNGSTVICTEAEVAETLQKLCQDSVHTYSETLREGYLTIENGYRVGVCGRAGVAGDTIRSIYGVTSLCVRIPHPVRGISDGLLPYLLADGEIRSALFYAAPGVGKTTLIRDLAARLSSGPRACRVALVDTREEIAVGNTFSSCLADVLRGYPRGKGIEIATRTLSPQVIFCDEIGSAEEANAILCVQNSGVPLIATAHAETMASLLKRPNVRVLYDAGIFRYYIGLSRRADDRDFVYRITDAARGEELAV